MSSVTLNLKICFVYPQTHSTSGKQQLFLLLVGRMVVQVADPITLSGCDALPALAVRHPSVLAAETWRALYRPLVFHFMRTAHAAVASLPSPLAPAASIVILTAAAAAAAAAAVAAAATVIAICQRGAPKSPRKPSDTASSSSTSTSTSFLAAAAAAAAADSSERAAKLKLAAASATAAAAERSARVEAFLACCKRSTGVELFTAQ